MVIYVDMINYSVKEAAKYLWSKCVTYFYLGPLHLIYFILKKTFYFEKHRKKKWVFCFILQSLKITQNGSVMMT